MSKCYFLLLISVQTSISCLSQVNSEQILKDTGQTAKQTHSPLPVLFATNEDCDLYINGQFKSIVFKSAHSYIKLSPGSYSYTVRSHAVGGEFNDLFVVKEGKVNEFFIDLLYFIDFNKQDKNNSKQIGKAETAASSSQNAIISK